MNQELFQVVLDKVMNQVKMENGIGTLSEKTIHAVLKNYYSPCEDNQERKVSPYVADILIDKQIIEIQTRNFNNLRRKLDIFLQNYDVTIVYPIAKIKWLRWIEETSGEISPKRKSPKIGTPYHIFFEMYRIKTYLNHRNLHFRIALLEVEEYRLLNGWSKDKKKGSVRNDGIPVALLDELSIDSPKDYLKLLPDELPETFTVKDYKQLTKLPLHQAGTAIHVLNYLNIITFVGKQGRAFLYTKNKDLL